MKGYLFVHFTGETEEGEQIYFALSEDGLHWEDLNGGRPALRSSIGEKGVRDPFILRSEIDKCYYIIATDLRIASGKGWEAAENQGSTRVILWKSRDLRRWSDPWSAELAVPGAGCVWAPEAVYDPEERAKQRIYCAYTRDFREFSEPELYIDRDNDVIDTTIIREGEFFYRFSKDETVKNIYVDRGKRLRGEFEPVFSETLTQLYGVEGPAAFPLGRPGAWCLLVDQFAERKGYLPLITDDLAEGSFRVLEPGEYDMGQSRKRHGSVLALEEREYRTLLERWRTTLSARADGGESGESAGMEEGVSGRQAAAGECGDSANMEECVSGRQAAAGEYGVAAGTEEGISDRPAAVGECDASAAVEDRFSPVWYTVPLFAGLRPRNVYHKEQEPEPEGAAGSEIRNLHVLARAEYFQEGEEDCCVRISADDYYKLYINGVFVAQGPAPGYPEHYYYNETGIKKYLRPGRNTIAVHLYYQGLVNRVWNSGDLRFGLGVQVGGPGGQGWKDLEWRYQISKAYSGGIVGYETQFLENFDGRLWEEGWKERDFDDSLWPPMVPAPWADYQFEEPAVPLLQVCRREPERVVRQPDGSWFVDMGCEVTGGLCVKARAEADSLLLIRCGEELEEDGTVRYHMRCGCDYEETWRPGEGIHLLEPYDYKGFRYASVHPSRGGEVLEVYGLIRHYPFEEEACVLKCGDRRMEQVFEICKNGAKYGTQEGYLDCPTREKGQYLGDAVVSAHSQVWLTGSTELLRKCVRQFAWTSRICPGLMGVAPGSLMQEIGDFSLLWPELLLLDYQFTGDKEFLREHYPTVKNMIGHFARYAREDGLLVQVADKWNLVDWPENLRDGYDFPLTRPVVAPGCHNVINALYIGAVKAMERIESLLGLPAPGKAEALKEAYIRTFYRRDQRLFADSETSSHCALHSNGYALYFGLVPQEAVRTVGDFLVKKGLCCGVMVSYFVLKGLARAGRYRDVYHLLVNESEHGWMNMVREGATTCWEAWGKEQKWNTSLCHPWASGPISILIEELAGVRPDPESPAGFRLEPHLPVELGDFSLRVPFRENVITIQRTGSHTACQMKKRENAGETQM